MKICKLIKVFICCSDYDFYYMVVGIGHVRVFNALWQAEKFIQDRHYTYHYSEITETLDFA